MSIAKTTRPYLLTREAAADRIEALEAALRQSVDDWRKRGSRIEALEAECDRWAEQANTTAASLRAKVKALEAALRGIIQTLESLNDTKRASFYRGSVVNELTMALDIASAALAPEQDK